MGPGIAGRSAGGHGSGRRRRTSGLVVGGLATAAVVVAAVLLLGTGTRGGHAAAGSQPGPATASPVALVGAAVWIAPGHTPDDAADVGAVIDGDPSTAWHTDLYHTARFGGLYPGLGVAVHLRGTRVLHHLVVTSSGGWTGEAFVAAALPPAAPGTTGWGAPTGRASATGRTTTISLAGRRGGWVLLWLTSVGGPPYQAAIDELQVS